MYFYRLEMILFEKVCGEFSVKYMNVHMVYKWIILMMKPLSGYALLYMYMCLHDHDYVMNFYFMVILRSTTEVVWELIAREEWLGCRHDVTHVGHTRVNTSVGSMYFSGFQYIKSMYMYNVFKIYM